MLLHRLSAVKPEDGFLITTKSCFRDHYKEPIGIASKKIELVLSDIA